MSDLKKAINRLKRKLVRDRAAKKFNLSLRKDIIILEAFENGKD